VALLQIPASFRRFTQNAGEYRFEGETVGEMLQGLIQQYPEIAPKILDESGNLRSYVHVFIGDRDVKQLQALKTPVDAGTVVRLVPAIAGG
jgi:adenylyltransferase/sulfurtransferase